MLNDSFDGNKGFHLQGGLKDAKYVSLPLFSFFSSVALIPTT
jgi:hypothetical protein